jgi:hypothetical protein
MKAALKCADPEVLRELSHELDNIPDAETLRQRLALIASVIQGQS